MKYIFLALLCLALPTNPSCAEHRVDAVATATIVEAVGISFQNKGKLDPRVINLAHSLHWTTFALGMHLPILKVKTQNAAPSAPTVTYNFP
jgi:hypothetical protein